MVWICMGFKINIYIYIKLRFKIIIVKKIPKKKEFSDSKYLL